MELSNMWGDPEEQMEAPSDTPVLIGSIRLVVCVSGIKTALASSDLQFFKSLHLYRRPFKG